MIAYKSMRAAATKMRACRPADATGEAGNVWMAAFAAIYAMVPEKHQEDFASEAGVREVAGARKAGKDRMDTEAAAATPDQASQD